jgi:hypothetical protein
MVLVPVLVIRRVPVKPVFHSLLTRYWQLPAAIALVAELDELAGADELITELATDEGGWLLAELLTAVLLDTLVPTMPNGAGCALQVLAVMQLLLFS